MQKRGLRIVYDEPRISLEKLPNRDHGISIRSKHINILTKIYKTSWNL